jgi:hypothetical protein
MKPTSLLAALMTGALALASGAPAHAQDARLTQRLDANTARQVGALVDSARRASLPTEPLVQKALEGASKGATAPVIISATRALLGRLAAARDALGQRTTESELVAGAAALAIGAPPAALRSLHDERPDGSVAAALVGLSFLLQRGVPADGSVEILRSMLRARLDDADFTTLQRLVDQDVRSGAPAADAAAVRARALIRHAPATTTAGGAR